MKIIFWSLIPIRERLLISINLVSYLTTLFPRIVSLVLWNSRNGAWWVEECLQPPITQPCCHLLKYALSDVSIFAMPETRHKFSPGPVCSLSYVLTPLWHMGNICYFHMLGGRKIGHLQFSMDLVKNITDFSAFHYHWGYLRFPHSPLTLKLCLKERWEGHKFIEIVLHPATLVGWRLEIEFKFHYRENKFVFSVPEVYSPKCIVHICYI